MVNGFRNAFGKLVDAFVESTIVQSFITFAVVGVWLYMLYIGKPIDDTLKYVVGTVVGFYFGSKSAQQARYLQQRVKRNE